jgi:hypothetical protein
MIERFLRLFEAYRELEKDLKREAALADSQERYIEALEGRDQERLSCIAELEAKLAEQHDALCELRRRLSGLLSGRTAPGDGMGSGAS